MNKSAEFWDKQSTTFTVAKDEVDFHAATNVELIWPHILNAISFSDSDGRKAVDYGCGTGAFTQQLYNCGYEVLGVDISPGMIEVAKSNYGKSSSFMLPAEFLNCSELYDLISSIMVFQFIADLDSVLKPLVDKISDNGVIYFAVHNPKYIELNTKADGLFQKDSNSNLFMCLESSRIPVFTRDADYYKELFSPYGLRPVLEEYPEFTDEFLEKYYKEKDRHIDVSAAESMILGFAR